jgi:hypothetical protein
MTEPILRKRSLIGGRQPWSAIPVGALLADFRRLRGLGRWRFVAGHARAGPLGQTLFQDADPLLQGHDRCVLLQDQRDQRLATRLSEIFGRHGGSVRSLGRLHQSPKLIP